MADDHREERPQSAHERAGRRTNNNKNATDSRGARSSRGGGNARNQDRDRSRSPRRDNGQRERLRERSPRPNHQTASRGRGRGSGSGGGNVAVGGNFQRVSRDQTRRVPKETDRSRVPERAKIEAPKIDFAALKDLTEDEVVAKVMGFTAFKTTQNTKVPGNDKNYGCYKKKLTRYRQYMNREGGFNRPLSPTR